MIKSMTGYGRFQDTVNGYDITVEIRSVNHRYFEFSLRTPRGYAFIEEKVKSFCAQKITRGKVECNVQIECVSESESVVELNHPLIKSYLEAFKEISDTYDIEYSVRLNDIVRLPDTFSLRKKAKDEEIIVDSVLLVAEKAVDNFNKMREIEGEKLRFDIEEKLSCIAECVEKVEFLSPESVEKYRNRLFTKLNEVLGDRTVDEARVITECALFADKIAVDEETVRLKSHLSQMNGLLNSGAVAGKKMDFVVQEMNRETNTIGSKAQNIEITNLVVEMKAQIEKIREQVQNVE
ncbi:MAG: YicC family protein [Clostridiales bacterium]|nr:YicC family protein [Clostridiales bacterium]